MQSRDFSGELHHSIFAPRSVLITHPVPIFTRNLSSHKELVDRIPVPTYGLPPVQDLQAESWDI
jgi:hypothetical protein